MAEQYIYTESTGGGGSEYGFLRRTPGIAGGIQNSIQYFAASRPEATDEKGRYLPVWEKRTLPTHRDQVLFQQAVRRRGSGTDTIVHHGYVVSKEDSIVNRADQWAGIPFWPYLEGGFSTELRPTLREAAPLAQVLEALNLSRESFGRILRACFDIMESDAQVLVAADLRDPKQREMAPQLLLWVFMLLPPALRRELDCITCIPDSKDVGRCFAMIPSARLRRSENRISVITRRGYRLGESFLFDGDRVAHSGRSGEFFRENTTFGFRLDAVAAACCGTREQAETALGELSRLYGQMDRLILTLPEVYRCRKNSYEALYRAFTMFDENGEVLFLPDGPELPLFEELLRFGAQPEVLRAMQPVLTLLENSYRAPVPENRVRLLAKLLRLESRDACILRARELMTALLSADMERAEIGESSGVSSRYIRVMTEAGMKQTQALRFLETVFFPADFPPVTDDAAQLWQRLGTARTEGEGIRRCSEWVSGYANICVNTDELLACAGTVCRELKGFSPAHIKKVLECLLGAQETRCYYARLEVRPEHLTECCRRIRKYREEGNEELAGYYDSLFRKLCRNFLQCWSGHCSLNAVTLLADTFRRELTEPDWDNTFRDLIIAQIAEINEYDWETLKKQFAGEDRDIFLRLQYLLELLAELGAPVTLGRELCSQVCRYILHGMPEYVNGDWIVAEMREYSGLEPKGYYLEMLTLRSFLQEEEQSLEQLQQCIKDCHVHTESMKDLMRFLYRCFSQGGLAKLQPVAAEGIYIACRDRIRDSQADVFRTVCRLRGADAFLELLDCWPQAMPANGSREKGRPGRYPWLRTGDNLLGALEELSGDKDFLREMTAAKDGFCMKLCDTVQKLVPPGARGRDRAAAVNRRLLEFRQKNTGLSGKLRCGVSKRRLLAE